MMNKPAINELLDKVDCRYLLVTAISARARQLQCDPDHTGSTKPVSQAVEDLYLGNITVSKKEG